jgi:hypothetical protein
MKGSKQNATAHLPSQGGLPGLLGTSFLGVNSFIWFPVREVRRGTLREFSRDSALFVSSTCSVLDSSKDYKCGDKLGQR